MEYPTYNPGEEPKGVYDNVEEPDFNAPEEPMEEVPNNGGDPILWLFIVVILIAAAVYITNS